MMRLHCVRNVVLFVVWVTGFAAASGCTPVPAPPDALRSSQSSALTPALTQTKEMTVQATLLVSETPTLIPTIRAMTITPPEPSKTVLAPLTETPTTRPMESLWYTPLAFSALDLSFSYAEIINPGAPVYLSLEEALARSKTVRHYPGGEVYVSFSATREVAGTTYYHLGNGDWMIGSDLKPMQASHFAGIGLAENQFVDFSFGWVLKDSYSVAAIDAAANLGVNFYPRYSVIRVLDSAQLDGHTWHKIAEDEWLPAEVLSILTPDATAPEGVAKTRRCRWISVGLEQQNLAVYDNCKLVFATLISSGKFDGWTGTGVYPIYSKNALQTILSPDVEKTGNYYLENVPWMLFYAGAWALHGAYWHDNFGQPWSHGCINLSPADAHWLFNWAKGGDLVYLAR